MKNVLIALFLVTLAACMNAPMFADDLRVSEFLEIYPEAKMTKEKFSTADREFINEFLIQECNIAPPFQRIVYQQFGAKLILYAKDDVIKCALSKIEAVPYIMEQGENGPENVALEVNGNPVMLEQIGAAIAQLPQEQQTIENINLAIDQAITQELLRQEASTYKVDEEKAYAAFLEQADITESTLKQNLAAQNVTLEAFKTQLVNEEKLRLLLEDKLGEIEADEEAARDFYLRNTNSFIVSEQASFQQIFINTQDMTQTGLETRLATIARSLNSTDFCTVVKQYSDDASSKEQCGMYTIPRGVVQPSIEQAAFTTPLNTLVVVQSDVGVHVMQVLERQPTTVLSYEQISDRVQGLLYNQIYQLRLNAYLASLRSQAEVVNYLTLEQGTA